MSETQEQYGNGAEKRPLTAVEWLIAQWPVLEAQLPERLIKEAKEREKEQIKEVFIDVSDVLLKETNTQQKAKIKQAAEQYYNQSYGKP